MSYYRKKPVVIEARQWDGTAEGATGIIDWALSYDGTIRWIIKGVQDEFYPCKPTIFDATYEPVPLEAPAS